MKAIFLSLALCSAASVSAADASKILLRGESVSVEESKVSGAARAIVGEVTISADSIAFEKEKNLLRCEGAVVVRTASGVISTRDCIFELVPGEKKVFFLSRGDIRVVPAMEPIQTSLLPASK